jgi:hypothetical protein
VAAVCVRMGRHPFIIRVFAAAWAVAARLRAAATALDFLSAFMCIFAPPPPPHALDFNASWHDHGCSHQLAEERFGHFLHHQVVTMSTTPPAPFFTQSQMQASTKATGRRLAVPLLPG